MTPCRLIVDPPRDGAWNMAVDEALLDDAAERGAATLRFYQWRKPTLSLGYFQRYTERTAHPPSRDAAAVRRLSGGGALVHDREVTYSLTLPADHPDVRQPPAVYGKVHRAIIAALASWSVASWLHGDHVDAELPGAEDGEPFLCFHRRTEFDVIAASRSGAPVKIVGSAQRRRRGAVLQHGSVLLARSNCAPEFPGAMEACGAAIKPVELIAALCDEVPRQLQLGTRPETLGDRLESHASELFVPKYAPASWLRRR